MIIACMYSHWTGEGEPDFYSFAAVTGKPPADVSEAGHDRCIVPIKSVNVDAWLNPAGKASEDMHAILENRERPRYEHRLDKAA